jgi:hypothetical protein
VDLNAEPNLIFIKDTIADIAKLFHYRQLHSSASSEAFILHVAWGFCINYFTVVE